MKIFLIILAAGLLYLMRNFIKTFVSGLDDTPGAPANALPSALNDYDTATEGGADATGNVMTADILGDTPTTVTAANQAGDAITIGVAYATAAGGSITINSDGSYTYTPPASGQVPPAGLTEVFQYVITDNDGDMSAALLTIDVSNVSVSPLAANDTDTATEAGAIVSGNVLTNDELGDLPTTVVSAVQGAMEIEIGNAFVTTNFGIFTLSADGSYTYEPPAQGQVPSAGFDDVFSYTIEDNDTDQSTATLTVTVSNNDIGPVASGDTANVGEGGTAVAGNVMSNDSLGDEPTTVTAADQASDPITIGVAYATSGGGSLTLEADGSYSYTPPAVGTVPIEGVTEVFNYTLTDNDGDTDSSTLTINVYDTGESNLLPVAANDSNAASEGGGSPVAGNVITNDVLGDEPTTVVSADQASDPITIGVAYSTAAGGSLTLNSNGSYSYTPPASGQVPPAGTSDVFNYTIEDVNGDQSSATLTITVANTNVLPIAANDTDAASEGGAAVTGNVLTNDSLGDEPTTVVDVVSTAKPTQQPATLGIPYAVGENGASLVINPDGSYTYTPADLGTIPPAGDTDVFDYTIEDSDGDQSTATLTITITNTNILPIAANDTTAAVEAGSAVTGNVMGNDNIGDGPTTVTAAAQGVSAITIGQAFSTDGAGSLTLNADGSYSYTPPATGVPSGGISEVFDYTITDSDSDESSATLTINVSDVDVPVVSSVIAQWEANMIATAASAGGGYYGPLLDPTYSAEDGYYNRRYYDGQFVYQQLYHYQDSGSWMTYAGWAETMYRDVNQDCWMGNNKWCNTSGYDRFPWGLFHDWESGGNTTAQELTNLATLPAWSTGLYFNSRPAWRGEFEFMSREVAYALQAHVAAEAAGMTRVDESGTPTVEWFVRFAESHLYEWYTQTFSGEAANTGANHRFAPFMFGLTMMSLACFYEWEVENGRDPNAYWPTTHWPDMVTGMATVAEWAFNTATMRGNSNRMWIADTGDGYGAFRYEDHSNSGAARDLNLLIAPGYAWIFKQNGNTIYRDMADDIFAGGVYEGQVNGYWGSKQFNQNYIYSFFYEPWRLGNSKNIWETLSLVQHKTFETGTLGNQAEGADDEGGDMFGVGYDHSGTVVDDTHAYKGTQSAKCSMTSGQNEVIGGHFNLTKSYAEGDEVWIQWHTYFPAGFSYDTNVWLKWLRMVSYTGGLQNKTDIYLMREQDHGSLGSMGWINEWRNEWVYAGDSGLYEPRFDVWDRYEIYVKVSDTDGLGMTRIWKNNNLVIETDKQNIANPGGDFSSLFFINYWNGGAPQNQSFWMDEIKVSENPARIDANGNRFIGGSL